MVEPTKVAACYSCNVWMQDKERVSETERVWSRIIVCPQCGTEVRLQ